MRPSRQSPRTIDVAREAPAAFSVGRALPGPLSLAASRPAAAPDRWCASSCPSRSAERTRLSGRCELPPSREVEEATRGHAGAARDREGRNAATSGSRVPLGLAWRQGRLELPWTATVYPRSARRLAPGAAAAGSARRREAGLRNVRRRGEGRLFEGLREWVPGDDTRIIDWKATARRGKPIARQYEDERRQQVLIVIDAGRLLTAEVDGVPRLEAVVAAALQLAHAAVEHDDNVGLLVFADTVQRYVAPARGRRALRAVLEGLGRGGGTAGRVRLPGRVPPSGGADRKRALTVLFTDVIDRTASDALVAHAATLRPRHLPLAVTLRDPALEALAGARPARTVRARSSGRRRRSCSTRARRRWPRCGREGSWCWTCCRLGRRRRWWSGTMQLKRRGCSEWRCHGL